MFLSTLKYSLLGSAFWSSISLVAFTVNVTNQYAVEAFQGTRDALIADIAKFGGYERAAMKIPDKTIQELCRAAAEFEGIEPLLYCALVTVESANQEWVFSPAGAIGPAQVMPANHKFCKLSSPAKLLDPKINIFCGAKLFKEQLITYNYDVVRALYGYNASPEGVRKTVACGHNTACMGPYKETYNHARKVLAVIAKPSHKIAAKQSDIKRS